ncbi:MAG: hypothetical protein QM779_16915 [Propionicimonas sp.]|uniref:hypothetical protein n=1 Tax=Propionicimonas sp. TaxID=1955623 RepID=UPI003D0D2518
MPRRFGRRAALAALGAGVLAAYLVVAASVPRAVVASGTTSRDFEASQDVPAPESGRCLTVTVRGTLQADWSEAILLPGLGGLAPHRYRLADPRVAEPSTRVDVTNSCSGDRVSVRVTRLELTPSFETEGCPDGGVRIRLDGSGVHSECGTVTMTPAIERTTYEDADRVTSSNSTTVLDAPGISTSVEGTAGRLCVRPVVHLEVRAAADSDEALEVTLPDQCVGYPQ